MPKRMHQNNPAYRWFFENRFRLSETSERFRRSTDMRSGWTMHSRSFLVLSIPLLKFLRLDAYADHNPPGPCARARALQRVHQSRSIVGDALFAIIDCSTAVLFIHAVKKAPRCDRMKGCFDPLYPRTGGCGASMAVFVSSEQPGDNNQSLIVLALTSAGTQL